MRLWARAVCLAGILLTAVDFGIAASQAPPPQKPKPDHDALTAARFELFVDGVALASFSTLESMSQGIDPRDLQLTPSGVVLPAHRQPPTVVLKRGLSRNLELQEWFEAAQSGDPAARKSCSLVMFNTKGDPVARYHLTNAWPAKVEIGSLKAGATEVLIETIVLVGDQLRDERLIN